MFENIGGWLCCGRREFMTQSLVLPVEGVVVGLAPPITNPVTYEEIDNSRFQN